MADQIVFDLDETDVPTFVKSKIQKYVSLLGENHTSFVQDFEDALNQFETTVSIGQEDRATPNAIEQIALSAINVAGSLLLSQLGKAAPAVPLLIDFWKGLSPRFNDSGLDQRGVTASAWIHETREVLNNWRSAFDRVLIGRMVEETTLQFLENENRQDEFDRLVEAIDKATSVQGPGIRPLEVAMYSAWIKVHFDGFREDGSGCIDYRLEPRESGRDIVVSCTVQAPFGARLARRLNTLLHGMATFRRPSDLNVTKRVCFCVEGIAGGHTWSCGWADGANRPIHKPQNPRAERAFEQSPWLKVERFFEADQSLFANPSSCADIGIHKHAD